MNRLTALILLLTLAAGCSGSGGGAEVYPDYRDVTVPCNIAPLNFFYSGDCGMPSTVFSAPGVSFRTRGRNVCIPARKWAMLLKAAEGSAIEVTSSVLGTWRINVSTDPIDEYLTYRLIEPGYEVWDEVEIEQRHLTDFSTVTLASWKNTGNSCMNCHIHKGTNSMFYLRGPKGGAILNTGGKLRKLNLRNAGMASSTVYGDLHPNGRWGVFSTNVIMPSFHTLGSMRFEVYDTVSDLCVADFETSTMLCQKEFTREDKFETFPCFNADGTEIYYCCADTVSLPKDIHKLYYTLWKAPFNIGTGEIGEAVKVKGPSGSVCHPKCSPDGKWILYTVADYGTFPLWHRECSLEMMNIEDGSLADLSAACSDRSDSYHSWSSNSRWIVFASKRGDGQYGRPYIAHIGEDGTASKAFVVPQKDPHHYIESFKSYNIPDLGTIPAPYDWNTIGEIWQNTEAEQFK